MNTHDEIELRIREYFRTHYNIEITDEDMPEVRQNLYHLGSAIARYIELQEKKRNTKTVRG